MYGGISGEEVETQHLFQLDEDGLGTVNVLFANPASRLKDGFRNEYLGALLSVRREVL